jgi:hypothetical protein
VVRLDRPCEAESIGIDPDAVLATLAEPFLDRLAHPTVDNLGPAGGEDIVAYADHVLRGGFPDAALRLDRPALLANGDLLGRLLESFVLAQVHPELAYSATRPRLFHLRAKGGAHEIDLIAAPISTLWA